jgi:hypothetical protein
VGIYLHHRHVGALIDADHLRLVFTPIREAHRHHVGVRHDVGIGQDVAVLADDEARAGPMLRLGTARPRVRARDTEAAEEVVERIVRVLATALGRGLLCMLEHIDVHDRGAVAVHQAGEVGQRHQRARLGVRGLTLGRCCSVGRVGGRRAGGCRLCIRAARARRQRQARDP